MVITFCNYTSVAEKYKTNKMKELTNDYLVLNHIGELSHIGKNRLAIGVRKFALMNQPCLMEFTHNGKNYKRLHTDVIPKYLVGKICSVQVYEQVS